MTTTTRRARGHAAPPAQPLHLTRDYHWRDDSACKTAEPELFFPVGSSGPARVQEEYAKSFCNRCPVRQECLDWAVETGQYTGVWGGLTETERRGLVRGGDTSFLRCLEDQEYIEQRLAKSVARRQVALELGVSYEMLRRAIRYFESEREQAAAATTQEEVAAA